MQQRNNNPSIIPFISFYLEKKSLKIEIETSRLYILSYQDINFENCVALYGDKSIVKYFDFGKARSRNEVMHLIDEKGNKYFSKNKPYGLFSIYYKNDMTFIGQIDLIPTDEPGTFEIGFIIHKQYHNQGYCSEAAKAFLFNYIAECNNRGYKYNEFPINKVIATTHPENYSSIRILEKLGMSFTKFESRFGNPRLWYSFILDSYKKQTDRSKNDG